MNFARSSFGAFVINDLIYVFGGFTGFQKVTNTIEIYNPKENKWTVLYYKSNGKLLANSLHFKKDNDIFIVGGTDGNVASNKILKYSLKDNELSLATTLENSFSNCKGI